MTAIEVFWALAAIGVVVGLGRAVVALVVGESSLHPAERWALSFIIGAGAISVLAFVLAPVFGMVPAIPLLTVVVGSISGISFLRRTRAAGLPSTAAACGTQAPHPSMPKTTTRGWLASLLAFGIAVQFGVLFAGAVLTPLSWDGLLNFEMKARLAMNHHPSGQIPLAYFSDSSRLWSHPSYPLLLPLTEFWMYGWVGQPHQVAVKLLFPLFYFSLAGLLFGALRRSGPESLALGGCFALGLIPSFSMPGGAVAGFADVPLAAASFGALMFTLLALTTGTSDAARVAGLLSAAAVWTKREGMVLAAYLALGALLWEWQRRSDRGQMIRLRLVAPLLVMPLSVAVVWLGFQYRYGVPDADFLGLTPAMLAANLAKLPEIAFRFLQELFSRPHWGFLWPAFALTVSLGIWRGFRRAEVFLLGAITLPIAAYAGAFLFSAWPSLADHIRTGFPRLLIPLAPVALIFMLFALPSRLMDQPDGAPDAAPALRTPDAKDAPDDRNAPPRTLEL